MDCFFTAFRCSLSYKLARSGSSDAEDAIWGGSRKAFSGSSSNSSAEEVISPGHHATSHMKRQRAAAFCMCYYECGRKGSVRNDEDVGGKAELFIKVEVRRGSEEERSRKIMDSEKKKVTQWWQAGDKKRRKLGKEEWVAGGYEAGDGNFLRRAPARLKKLMWKMRAQMRKMGQVQKNSTSFQYDPLSYSMNFDDGCWQNCESHARFFYSPSLSGKSSL